MNGSMLTYCDIIIEVLIEIQYNVAGFLSIVFIFYVKQLFSKLA